MINVRIRKQCKLNVNDESGWIVTHTKFCRIGDIVRINDVDKNYKVISDPEWDDSAKDWNMKMEIYYES